MMTHSPFPGMDPFLEEPTEWSSVHAWLIPAIAGQLVPAVAPHFSVKIEQRVYVTLPEEPETKERYIEIRDSRNREVATIIELLSPFNKSKGTPGYDSFWRKRQEVMRSKVNWIEIDLLRAGERPKEVAGKSDYYVLLKRGETPGPYEVWYFDLRDVLPTIAVPLRPPFSDVPLNLQTAFDEVYTRGGYTNDIDYTGVIPLPKLRPADAVWVRQQVQTWLKQQET